ncbi:hypothetical protein CTAYLR_007679 [Chrysophaeum taylorii]|uniref:J domain-containing protein n=1 Tax=Chrysophaeum taylorii TaxID=2483200 RepID=A0AAD7XHW4_9STRA|nr:hypothetical protein CTAYLR_007679 [Chrysophaeum taylorii]
MNRFDGGGPASSSSSYANIFRSRDRRRGSNGEAGEGEDTTDTGWRLSDRLYELSLEAEEEEKRQRRAATLQADALHDAQRDRARLRAQLDEAREEARRAMDEVMGARGAAREREEDYAREVVVLRAEVARCRQELHEAKARLSGCSSCRHEPFSAVPEPLHSDVDEVEEDAAGLLEAMAASGDESGLRLALSPSPRASTKAAYRNLLSRALVAAAEAGCAGACKLLVRRGVLDSRRPLARRRTTGWTAVHAAAYSRCAEVVEILVSTEACAPQPPEPGRASADDPLDLADAKGRTALMVAAERRAPDAVRALMRAGADAELRLRDDQEGEQDVSDEKRGHAAAAAAESKKGRAARDLCEGDRATLAALESAGERFWNASAAGNRAWRRKDFSAALAHFSAALALSAALSQQQQQQQDAPDSSESPPSGVDLARLELNCAKAALRLGRALDAAERADAALDRHRTATRGGVYANALAVRAECREAVHDFDAAAADFDELVKVAETASNREDARSWRDRARRARESRDATHYAILGIDPRADDAEVKRAYKRASMRWHPDRRRDLKRAPTARDDRARAERHFRRINEAKETLLDSYKRAVYDVENRRRLAAEADRVDDENNKRAWPWHAPPRPAAEESRVYDAAVSSAVRYARPWRPVVVVVVGDQKEEPDARRLDDETAPAPARVSANNAKKSSSSESAFEDESKVESSEVPDEWSWRLGRYEDDQRREERQIPDEAQKSFSSDRREPATNGDEDETFRGIFDRREEEDDDDLGTSLADALADDALYSRSENTLDDDLDDAFANSENDLAAQLRDAAEWFDVLDAANKGELDMAHFDELVDRLGLSEVLGEDEMQRQRFFADPVGAGVLRRGAFLGWFAALLEGSDSRAAPNPPSREAYHAKNYPTATNHAAPPPPWTDVHAR